MKSIAKKVVKIASLRTLSNKDGEADVELLVDADAVIAALAERAANNSSWRASLLGGAIVVRARPSWVRKRIAVSGGKTGKAWNANHE